MDGDRKFVPEVISAKAPSVTSGLHSLAVPLVSQRPAPYAPPMKPRVTEISKTSVKITGIIRDPKTGMVINTEEAMDAMYKYLVKKYRRKIVRAAKR